MKRLLTALLLTLLLSSGNAQETNLVDPPKDFPFIGFSINPIYHSIGVRLGNVLTIRRERPVLRTFEGEQMLGFGTNPRPIVDRQCVQSILGERSPNQQATDANRREADRKCFLVNNPSRFSTLNSSLYDKITEIKDQPLLIYYITHHIAPSHVLMRTRDRVLRGFPTIPNLRIDPSFRIPSWSELHPESGVITGRVVQASLEFSVRKSYEIIIQENQNGDNFRAMSVNDGNMFRYIMHAMLTGKLLRIEFVRLYRPHAAVLSFIFNYMTDFRIISVEIIGDS